MKETTASTPLTTGRGGGLATATLLVFSRQTENGGPLAPAGNSPAWPDGRATGGQRPRGKTRKAGVGSSAQPKSGVLSPGVVSFHSRRDGLAERPYVTSLLTHTTHRTLRRLQRAWDSDWPPSRGGWSRRSTAQARRPAPPPQRLGAAAPPPARARTFYSPFCRSAEALGAGSVETEKGIWRESWALGGEGAGLGPETLGPGLGEPVFQWLKCTGLSPCTCSSRPFYIHYFIVLSWHPCGVLLLPDFTVSKDRASSVIFPFVRQSSGQSF